VTDVYGNTFPLVFAARAMTISPAPLVVTLACVMLVRVPPA
jgi:hypothetical protein